MRRLIPFLITLFVVSQAAATEPWPRLTWLGTATVVSVVDGDTVVIDPPLGGKSQVRLVGIQAPKLPLGRKGFETWPLAPESRDALVEMIDGQRVDLYVGASPGDRHGRHLAHLWRSDGVWVQGEMLRLGWARVYSFPDNRSGIAAMLDHEREARAGRAGIWGHPNYAVRSPDELADLTGRFEVVEGLVVDATVHKGTGYVNFGEDWRSDFTLAIRKNSLKRFREANIEVRDYTGKRVRARGWLKSRNGPLIEITHPEQIEILEPTS